MINKVISVCCKADGKTFEIASKYIQKHIIARRYVVIVPESDLAFFSSLSLGSYDVVNEEKYSHIAEVLKNKKLQERFGWYFQQFIKMSELEDGIDDDINVIWDADTLPLRKISFTIDGKLFFYQGKEHHKPYFKLIQKLLGIDKLSSTSFVAQCMPYRVEWFKQFSSELEEQSGVRWYEHIIDLIDAKEGAGFSEYETLGTYATKNFKDSILISKKTNDWYRFANSLCNGPQNVEKFQKRLSKNFDFISFEKWDNKKLSIYRRFKHLYFGVKN